MTGGYGAEDTARRTPEPPKRARTSGRGPFERDRARVLHSRARAGGHTQVVEVGSGDFAHPADPLAGVRRSAGSRRVTGLRPDPVEARLAHDLGHPPFGHNGEAVERGGLAAAGSEGNAQSLWLHPAGAKVPGRA